MTEGDPLSVHVFQGSLPTGIACYTPAFARSWKLVGVHSLSRLPQRHGDSSMAWYSGAPLCGEASATVCALTSRLTMISKWLVPQGVAGSRVPRDLVGPSHGCGGTEATSGIPFQGFWFFVFLVFWV